MKYDYATNSPTAMQPLNECKTFNLLNDTAIPSFRYSLSEKFLVLEYRIRFESDPKYYLLNSCEGLTGVNH